MQTISHFIFDLDGTLLDSEGTYTEAAQRVVSRHGKVFTLDLKRRCMGGDALCGAQLVVDTLALPMTAEAYLEARQRELVRLLEHVRPMEGAEKLLRDLAALGIPMAIATSGHRDLTEQKLARHRFLRAVECVVCGDDPRLEQPKPAPDIFLLAAAELSAFPEQCAVVEDSVNGVQAALAAGMHTIAMVDPRFEFDPSAFADAHAQIRSLSELRLEDLGILPSRAGAMRPRS
jgi:pseudouridine 5'-phosphatase